MSHFFKIKHRLHCFLTNITWDLTFCTITFISAHTVPVGHCLDPLRPAPPAPYLSHSRASITFTFKRVVVSKKQPRAEEGAVSNSRARLDARERGMFCHVMGRDAILQMNAPPVHSFLLGK